MSFVVRSTGDRIASEERKEKKEDRQPSNYAAIFVMAATGRHFNSAHRSVQEKIFGRKYGRDEEKLVDLVNECNCGVVNIFLEPRIGYLRASRRASTDSTSSTEYLHLELG
jgi:hypothetical protein